MKIQSSKVFSSLKRIFNSKIHIYQSQITILKNAMLFEQSIEEKRSLNHSINEIKGILRKLNLMAVYTEDYPEILISLLNNDRFEILDISQIQNEINVTRYKKTRQRGAAGSGW